MGSDGPGQDASGRKMSAPAVPVSLYKQPAGPKRNFYANGAVAETQWRSFIIRRFSRGARSGADTGLPNHPDLAQDDLDYIARADTARYQPSIGVW